MRKPFALLLLLCLLLCGCAGEAVQEEPATIPSVTEAPAPTLDTTGFYIPGSALEAETNGAVRAYPLSGQDASGILPLRDGILVFSCTESTTLLTVLTGDTFYSAASLTLDFALSPEDSTLRRWDGGISFYDPITGEVVVLDSSLREISRIAAPEDMTGAPLLSGDRTTLYYCTASAIRALDLESGISRVLKEIRYPSQNVTGLWLDDTVLECSLSDNETQDTLYLSTVTGETMYMTANSITLTTAENSWYASFLDGSLQVYLFGQPGEEPAVLAPDELSTDCHFLAEDNAAVIIRQPDMETTVLDYYDLETGLLTSSLTLEADFYPWCVESAGNGQVAFLCYDEAYDCNTLYCWDTTALPSGNTQCYTGPYYTMDEPDYDGLAACTLYAQEISEKHGIQVLVYRDAVEVQPWDYEFTYEYQPRVLMQELKQLDARLENFPDGVLQTLAEQYTGLRIAIVRSISGSPESGSLDTAVGIQFWEEYDAYIVLTAGMNTEYTLYHELYHLIDTYLLNETNAFDQWDLLNPVGFSYDFDYIANQTRNSSEYLREDARYFIDTYSMSYPKEDRARIMEYAMTEGNESYFQCDTMQKKLKTICEGIRKAFGLRKSPETFLWEQYLEESLAYSE
ncbi:MAG: hypothetical protein IJ001_05785 [Oscillospiraceae bacterium]|nr:hypothetical protein [Oscillospiraceae bacterium]